MYKSSDKLCKYIAKIKEDIRKGYIVKYTLGTNVQLSNVLLQTKFSLENNFQCLNRQFSRELCCANGKIIFLIFWYNKNKRCTEVHIIQYDKLRDKQFKEIGVIAERTPLFFSVMELVTL